MYHPYLLLVYDKQPKWYNFREVLIYEQIISFKRYVKNKQNSNIVLDAEAFPGYNKNTKQNFMTFT